MTKLAVIGVFFDMEAGGNFNNSFLGALQTNMVTPGGSRNLTGIPSLEWINDLDKNKFYNYEGSLTTPGCDEIVTWLVINDPQPISS